MTKADIVSEIAKSTGVEKVQVQAIVEAFMESIKTSLTQKNNVYLRGFGSFIVKKRAKKVLEEHDDHHSRTQHPRFQARKELRSEGEITDNKNLLKFKDYAKRKEA